MGTSSCARAWLGFTHKFPRMAQHTSSPPIEDEHQRRISDKVKQPNRVPIRVEQRDIREDVPLLRCSLQDVRLGEVLRALDEGVLALLY